MTTTVRAQTVLASRRASREASRIDGTGARSWQLVSALETESFDRVQPGRDRHDPPELGSVPARIASSGRRITLHLPGAWPWETAWTAPFDLTLAPP